MTNKRIKVRAECPECADGYIGHMTVDELLERRLHQEASLACPWCGRLHLSREEVDQCAQEKIVYSEQYRQIRLQAEAVAATATLPGGQP